MGASSIAMIFHPQRDLYQLILEGLQETPPWGRFLQGPVAIIGARRALLLVTTKYATPSEGPLLVHAAAPEAVGDPPLDFARLSRLNLHPHTTMRPARVYSLDEMLDFNYADQVAFQRAELRNIGSGRGRHMDIAGTRERQFRRIHLSASFCHCTASHDSVADMARPQSTGVAARHGLAWPRSSWHRSDSL